MTTVKHKDLKNFSTKYTEIKRFDERCETHPEHQEGVISGRMLRDRLHEEIAELREYIEEKMR